MKGVVQILLPPRQESAPAGGMAVLAPLFSLCAECGYEGSLRDLSRDAFDLDRLEDQWRLDPPAAVLVVFDPDIEQFDGEVLADICDIINRTEYLGIRTILLGKTPAANPAIFLSQSAAVIVHPPDPSALLDLLRSDEWSPERLLNLPGVSVKINGQIVRSGI